MSCPHGLPCVQGDQLVPCGTQLCVLLSTLLDPLTMHPGLFPNER